MPHNRKVVLAQSSPGRPEAAHFAVIDAAVPEPGPGQVLVRHEHLSLDPYMASAIKGRHMSGAIAAGDTMPGETVGRVVASRHDDFVEGDRVISRGGWQLWSVADPADPRLRGIAAALSPGVFKLPAEEGISPSLHLGALGMPGLTAFAGVRDVLAPKPGECFVVSAASGAVGATAGQIARAMGARVIGIAGSVEKCAHVVDGFGFDGCVNRTDADWKQALTALCPDGIDAYFDTVGGEILKAVMPRLAMNGRVMLCGMMEQYNSPEILPGPSLAPILQKRATITGFVVYDHWEKLAQWRRLGAQWIRSGRLRFRESIVIGLESAPQAFCDMMAGRNFGKTIVALNP